MAVGKVNSLAAASIAKINTLAKASIGKLSSIANAFVAAFTDDKAVSKSISTGTGESIQIASTTHFNFVQSDAFSIGFWIRAGWTANLNTNIHFFAMNDGSSTARNESIRIFYLENNNRLQIEIAHDNNNRSQQFWFFHHTGAGEAGAVSGLGTSFPTSNWSATNRGGVNGDNFTHIMITKGTGTTLTAANTRAYWNGVDLGDGFYANGNNLGTISMDASSARRICLGSNAHTFAKSGDGAETVYNDLTIYNTELSSDQVSELYNSSTPTDATQLSSAGNLRGYYTFEDGDGSDSSGTSGPTFTVNGDSNIESI